MRVLVSVDMEGIAGVVGWGDTIPGREDYERARRLMTGEANAAVRGALAFDGHAEVFVADGHALFRNLLPDALDRRARLLRGFPRAGGMLAGLERGIDAVLLIGYHGKAGSWRSVLAHTMNGQVILDVRCQGQSLGEIGLNVALAGARGATTVLVTGDDTAVSEALQVVPAIHTVEVKRALGEFAADSLHPEEACERIAAAVVPALECRAEIEPLRFEGPVELEVDLARPVMIEPLLLVPGLERVGPRTIGYRASRYEDAYSLLEFIATGTDPARAI
jgi:D-amino peptidase